MKTLYRICIAFCLAFGCFSSAAIAVDSVKSGVSQNPLIVIRFNQNTVPYERPLYNIISRALEVKPSVMFDIVSVVPRANDRAMQAQYTKLATYNTKRVLTTLREMGLPKDRMNVTQSAQAVTSDEVRIFVR